MKPPKKISILTFAKGDNYGALFQSYALYKVLISYSYNVEFISLTWDTLKHKIFSFLIGLRSKYKKFRKTFIQNYSKNCSNFQDLTEVIKDSGICIVGSDQVWNPNITTIRCLHYFFDFVPDNKIKIAYAASFGTDKWIWDSKTKEVENLLKRFDAISVREKKGVDICRETFHVKAIQVLDPTLLLGEFNELIVNVKTPEKYILNYRYFQEKDGTTYLKILSKKLDLPILNLDTKRRNYGNKEFEYELYSPTPQEWISIIKKSSLVITDSFHAVCFSIIFSKDFMVLIPPQLRHLEERISSLLQMFNLTNRIFHSFEELYSSNLIYNKINFTNVNRILKEKRKESLKFLLDSISIDKKSM